MIAQLTDMFGSEMGLIEFNSEDLVNVRTLYDHWKINTAWDGVTLRDFIVYCKSTGIEIWTPDIVRL